MVTYELIQLVGDDKRQDSEVLDESPLVFGSSLTNVHEGIHADSISKEDPWNVT